MRIGLVDVDGTGRFPNIALMKISAWHKSIGDTVEWYEPMFSGPFHLGKIDHDNKAVQIYSQYVLCD